MGGMLLVSFGGTVAQTDPPQDPNPLSGKDRAIDAIEVNLARQIAQLEELLATAPDPALAGIQTSRRFGSRGQTRWMAAVYAGLTETSEDWGLQTALSREF